MSHGRLTADLDSESWRLSDVHWSLVTVDIHGSNLAMHFSTANPPRPSLLMFVTNGPAWVTQPADTNRAKTRTFRIAANQTTTRLALPVNTRSGAEAH